MSDASKLVDHFFRHEYGRLVAALTRALGVRHLQLIEDVVQQSLYKAIQTWGQTGVPDNPSAWLFRSAKNLAIDSLRRLKKEEEWSVHSDAQLDRKQSVEFELGELQDDVLRLLFLCANPTIPTESAIAFALKNVSGFGTDEVAAALLISRSNAEKRITRARERLREQGLELRELTSKDLADRLPTVHSMIYLIFNEGFACSSGDTALRCDLCDEAIRLAKLLHETDDLEKSETAALLGLFLMHSARFDARVDTSGAVVLLDKQDRRKWNWNLVREAMSYMAESTKGNSLTRYHLEGAIAWEHSRAQAFSEVDWSRVVQLYEFLLNLAPTSMVRLNRAIAISYRDDAKRGLEELVRIEPEDRSQIRPWWDCAIAEMYWRLKNFDAAIMHWQDGLALTNNGAQRELIISKIAESQKSRSCNQAGS